jgi:hypothetical protein
LLNASHLSSKVDHNYLYSDLSVRRIQNFGIAHPDLIKLPSLNPSHKGHFIPKSR